MALGCVFHLNITEAMLLQKKRDRRMLGALRSQRTFQQLRVLKSRFLELAKLNILETGILDTQYNSTD